MKFTKSELKNSQVYKDWVTQNNVVVIHDIYTEEENDSTFLVIEEVTKGEFSISRFFAVGETIMISVDYQNLQSKEVFSILLKKYSNAAA